MSDSQNAGRPLGLSGNPSSGKKPVRAVDLDLMGFKITLSFKEDCTEVDDMILTKYLDKKCDMFHIVAERGASGKRHLHALMCCKEKTVKRHVQDTLWKKYKGLHPTSSQKYAVRVDVLYDGTWYDEYLRKEETSEIVASNYDPSNEHRYYATTEQQELLQVIAADSKRVDVHYASLASEFNEWLPTKSDKYGRLPTVDREICLEFLYHRMYVSKVALVCAARRRVWEQAQALYRYVTGDCSLDFEDRKTMASAHGPTIDFRA